MTSIPGIYLTVGVLVVALVGVCLVFIPWFVRELWRAGDA